MEHKTAFAAAMDEFKRAKKIEGELRREMLDAQARAIALSTTRAATPGSAGRARYSAL